jgi:hypothetical protein
MTVFTLYFGEAVPGRGDVTPAEWASFAAATLSAELPSGYTVMDARGAWTNPGTGVAVTEATKVLVVALPPGRGSLTAVNRVRSEYQTRFHQQLVGMTAAPACAAF